MEGQELELINHIYHPILCSLKVARGLDDDNSICFDALYLFAERQLLVPCQWQPCLIKLLGKSPIRHGHYYAFLCDCGHCSNEVGCLTPAHVRCNYG